MAGKLSIRLHTSNVGGDRLTPQSPASSDNSLPQEKTALRYFDNRLSVYFTQGEVHFEKEAV